MSLTEELYALIANKEITQDDLDKAALYTLDAIACALAGRRSPQGEILLAWGRARGAAGGNAPADAGRRALLIGALTHILEMDDLHRASVVHPGCVVVPAVWALGEAGAGNSDGRKLLRAVLWGFEATCRVGMAVGPAHYRIFHNTATCGPFGSAAAAAHLLGLDERQAMHALGNAGTQAAGFWEFLETGAMSKHLHAGRGAEAGIIAAELAQHGFTGAPDILEGQRGFFAGMCPDATPEAVTASPDAPWQVHLTSIKPWPACRHTHPAIDAAQEVRRALIDAGHAADDIASVRIEAYQAALDLCDRRQPDSVYGAKFSLQHTVAAALSFDAVDFAAFEEDARDACAGLRGKIDVAATDEFQKPYPDHWGGRVRAETKDGAAFEAMREDTLGDPELPLDADGMMKKAHGLLEYAEYDDAAALIEGILGLAQGGPLPRLSI